MIVLDDHSELFLHQGLLKSPDLLHQHPGAALDFGHQLNVCILSLKR
jgi:hypothetical protein